MTDLNQQIDQALCPSLTRLLRGNQLSQVVGVAQPMLVQQFAVRFASVVNQGAKKPHQNTESVENCCPGSDGA